METSYGVGINNRYALFLDEEGEESEEILIKANKEAANKAKTAVVTAAAAAPQGVKKANANAKESAPGAPAKEANNKQSNNNKNNNKRNVNEKNERNNREGGRFNNNPVNNHTYLAISKSTDLRVDN